MIPRWLRLVTSAAGTTAVLITAPLLVQADVVFDNSPADTGQFLGVIGASADPPFDTGYNGWATPFTIANTYTLSEIDVAVSLLAGSDSIIVSLWKSNGFPPGTTIGTNLDSQTISTAPVAGDFTAATFTDVIGPGTYWISVLPGATDTVANWYQNSGLTGVQAFTGDAGATWSATGSDFFPGVARVLGTQQATVPGPAGLLAVGGGLLALRLVRTLRRNS